MEDRSSGVGPKVLKSASCQVMLLTRGSHFGAYHCGCKPSFSEKSQEKVHELGLF